MKTINYYLYQGQEVVLLFCNEVEELNPSLKPIYSESGEIEPFLLTEEVRNWIEEGMIDTCLTYDDCYVGDWIEPVEIEYTEIVNYENDQHTLYSWVSVEYAEHDRAERDLCVTTSQYHSWTSKRGDIVSSLKKTRVDWEYDRITEEEKEAEIAWLQKRWEEHLTQYPQEILADLSGIEFSDLLEEVF